MKARFSIMVAVFGLMLACGEDLAPASLIEGPRVIGARTVIEADAARAWPEPGEEARVEFVVVDAGAPPPLTWGFIACALADRSFGIDQCSGDPLGFALQPTPPDVGAGEDPTPHIDFGVPAEANAETSILVLGAICFSGTPTMDFESEQPCEGEGASGTLVTFTVPVAAGGVENAHPELEVLRLGGDDWTYDPPSDTPLSGCMGEAGVPQISLDGSLEQEFQIVSGLESFESYEIESGDPPMTEVVTEEIQVSLFATSGALEGLYAFAEMGDTEMSVKWERSPSSSPDGDLVRFYFVLRDGRAGLSVASRALCATP